MLLGNSLVPYRGKEPHIFLSYAHKNKKAAMDIVMHLQSAGFRVWYDEGIDPGSEWDESIAAQIEQCSYFVAILSSAFLDSPNCKDELNYARDLNKPRLLIYLENIRLPSGMHMRLSRLQAIYKHKYDDQALFYEKLYAAQGLNACRDETISVRHATEKEPQGALNAINEVDGDNPKNSPIDENMACKQKYSLFPGQAENVDEDEQHFRSLKAVEKAEYQGMYLQTIWKSGEGHGKYMSRDKGEYGEVILRLAPVALNRGVQFKNAVADNSVPKAFVSVVQNEVLKCAQEGSDIACPIVGVSVSLTGGGYHPVASSERAFREAAKIAFFEAFAKASPELLHAVGLAHIKVSVEYIEQVLNETYQQRYSIMGMNLPDINMTFYDLKCEIPLPELERYCKKLNSITKGTNQVVCEFARYDRSGSNTMLPVSSAFCAAMQNDGGRVICNELLWSIDSVEAATDSAPEMKDAGKKPSLETSDASTQKEIIQGKADENTLDKKGLTFEYFKRSFLK